MSIGNYDLLSADQNGAPPEIMYGNGYETSAFSTDSFFKSIGDALGGVKDVATQFFSVKRDIAVSKAVSNQPITIAPPTLIQQNNQILLYAGLALGALLIYKMVK